MSRDKQRAEDGFGPLMERRYWVDFHPAERGIGEVMAEVTRNIAEHSPRLLADFEKQKGSEHRLRPGDEFFIEILGPWNGEVVVKSVSENGFVLSTLDGHPEAGDIAFVLTPHETIEGALRFEICSLARSRDASVAVAYDGIGVGKKAQETVWVEFCRRVVVTAGGEAIGKVEVRTLYEDDLRRRAEDPSHRKSEAQMLHHDTEIRELAKA